MKRLILYIHGMGGNAGEAARYRPLFPSDTVCGMEYQAENPWTAMEEFPALFDQAASGFDRIDLIASSIGALYALYALASAPIGRAFLISPIVDMERLITDMRERLGIPEADLQAKGEIPTPTGETLSYAYLCWIRSHPINWKHPTYILRGGLDTLQSEETIRSFAKALPAEVTVMENGEHWFHTEEQMRFLDQWLIRHGDV